MAEYYVWEGGGDNGGAGSQGDPWATVAYALTQMGGGDELFFRSSLVAYNKPNLGGASYVAVRFVDAALGTDDGNHGKRDGANAWKTIQYALDNIGTTGWVFCKGTETLAATVDVDANHTAVVVEGYTTNPRDGGRYTIDGNGAATHCFEFAITGNHVVLGNMDCSGQTSHCINLGNPPPAWSCFWNVKAAAASNRRAFYASSSSTRAVLLFCETADAQYGLYSASAMIFALGCHFVGHSYSVYAAGGAMLYRCVCDSPSLGVANNGSYLLAVIESVLYGSGGYGINSSGVALAIDSIIYDFDGNGFQGTAHVLGLNADVCASPGSGDNFHEGQIQTNAIITSDPQLVDPANDDFRVKPTSPCFNGGLANLHLLTTLSPVGHILGAYVPRVTHPNASRLAPVGNPYAIAKA